MKGKLSVIIPVYNTYDYLEKALTSIVNQTYQNLEIIIIDDGSTDRSEDIYNEFAAKDNRIFIYKEPNSGVSYARNTGLALATGDYITFFDSDDWINIEAYEEMIRLLEKTNTDIVMCGYVNEFEDDKYLKANYNIIQTELKSAIEILKDILMDKNQGFIFNKIFKREVLYKNNILFNKQLSVLEDLYFLIKVCETKPQFVCTEKAYYHYFRRDSSITNAVLNEKKIRINSSSEVILKEIKLNFPELYKQAAEFFYNTNIVLLNDVCHTKPINWFYRDTIKSSIRNAGLLNRVGIKVRMKVILNIYLSSAYDLIKKH